MAPAKPLVVGSFVVGALALGVIGILLFGGRSLFTRVTRVVVVFTGSVAGLEVGSPVTFRGVRIGKVSSIRVLVNVQSHQDSIPVYLDLEPDLVTWKGGRQPEGVSDLAMSVKSGLRAQLISLSYVTGQLTVNLDTHPDLPVITQVSIDGVPEIPSIPSDLQDIKDQFRRLDLPALGQRTRDALLSMQRTLDTLNGAIGPVTQSLQSTLDKTTQSVSRVQADATRTLATIDQLALDGRAQLKTNGEDLDRLLRTAQQTATEADSLLASLNDLTDAHSEMRGDLQASLRDLAASSSSLRGLTEDLRKNPVGTLLRSD
jgi:paraquat-inducible protein B